MRGALVVCGATSDAGKSWVVTGLCRLLARRGVSVAPFKGQNMALNASVTTGGVGHSAGEVGDQAGNGAGGEIGHAQWVQAIAAGVEPEVAMNPVLLKPTGERSSQVVVLGRAVGDQSAADYQSGKAQLKPVVLDALADLRRRYDVVICEGAGGAAEINLLDGDLANLPLAAAAGLPAIVVGDIHRGGVVASLYGTWALLPDDLRSPVKGFVINRFRGDPALLGGACEELERRTGVPVLGVIPEVPGTDIDAEDSLALDGWSTEADMRPGVGAGLGVGAGEAGEAAGPVIDVAAIRFPRVANFGDLDPLRLEPSVSVRWVRSAAALGSPDLVVLPGSKSTRADLEWLRSAGLDSAIERCGATVLAVCAGAQMAGLSISDPVGVEGSPGEVGGLGWLGLRTVFADGKVLDRPSGRCLMSGETVAGYRIHNGRIQPAGAGARQAEPWLVADDGTALGWRSADGRVLATTLHGLLESDGFRAATLARVSAGFTPSGLVFADARAARFDLIADALESSLDMEPLLAIVEEGALPQPLLSASDALGAVAELVPHLRARIGPPAGDDLVASELAADQDRLAEVVAASAAGRGSEDPQVLASLWWQAYSYRVAGTSLAAWVISGAAADPAAAGTGVGTARSRPSSLLVDPAAPLIEDLGMLVERLVAGHLAPLIAAIKDRHQIGTRLLHGNLTAAVASALGAIKTAEGAPPMESRLERATEALAGALEPDLGAWSGPSFRRTTCCLWWKTSAAGGAMCEDCSLRGSAGAATTDTAASETA